MKVYTQGTFDLFHVGHLNLLKRCRRIAGDGEVIVSLLTDDAIKRYKGKAPVIPLKDRASILESLKYVDRVLSCELYNTEAQILTYEPDLIVVGSDWSDKDLAKQYGVNKEWLYQSLIYVPYTERESSTKIKERIKND